MFLKSSNVSAWAVFCLLNGFTTTVNADFNVSGWLETVNLSEFNELSVLAKVDTGADSSSIHALDIEYFEQNEHTWVRFKLLGQWVMSKPVLKTVLIKPKLNTEPVLQRPVVELMICYGAKLQKVAFNLTDRAHLKTPVLIGRSDIPQGWVVDPHQTQLLKPVCLTD